MGTAARSHGDVTAQRYRADGSDTARGLTPRVHNHRKMDATARPSLLHGPASRRHAISRSRDPRVTPASPAEFSAASRSPVAITYPALRADWTTRHRIQTGHPPSRDNRASRVPLHRRIGPHAYMLASMWARSTTSVLLWAASACASRTRQSTAQAPRGDPATDEVRAAAASHGAVDLELLGRQPPGQLQAPDNAWLTG
jgi:hypothetical protein